MNMQNLINELKVQLKHKMCQTSRQHNLIQHQQKHLVVQIQKKISHMQQPHPMINVMTMTNNTIIWCLSKIY